MADVFPRFNDLPPELRLAIWIFTLPTPFLMAEKSLSITNRGGPRGKLRTFLIDNYLQPTKRPVPAVLHVYRESRTEFLAHDLATQPKSPILKRNGHDVFSYLILNRKKGAQFFSAENDSLLLTMDSFRITNFFSPSPFSLIRHLVLITDSTHFFPSRAADFLLPFSNLETLTIVLKITVIGASFRENHYFPPEINGQLDLESFSRVRKHDISDEISRIEESIKVTKERSKAVAGAGTEQERLWMKEFFPEDYLKDSLWKGPKVFKWRMWEQFLEEVGGWDDARESQWKDTWERFG